MIITLSNMSVFSDLIPYDDTGLGGALCDGPLLSSMSLCSWGRFNIMRPALVGHYVTDPCCPTCLYVLGLDLISLELGWWETCIKLSLSANIPIPNNATDFQTSFCCKESRTRIHPPFKV